MPNIRNTFLGGKMNKDADLRLVPNQQYIDANNIQIANSEGSDVGAIENCLSNIQLTTLDLGTNVITVGTVTDNFRDRIYWLIKSDTGSYIAEFNGVNNTPTLVLKDTRAGNNNVLGFDENYLVTGINVIVDSDNDIYFLAWTDNNKPPRIINIDRAKAFAENGFDEKDINLIKKPPLYAPVLTLQNASNEENNIEEKFLAFSHRYKTLDGFYTALSPFTEYAFQARTYNFNFGMVSNESMLNTFNQVSIDFDTGDSTVTDIEVVFKESGSNNVYLVETYNKDDEVWAHNETRTILFDNNKVYRVLPEDELFRLYDNVPRKAKAQEVIENRLIFGNYTENYNLIDCDLNDVKINFTLDYTSTAILNDSGTRSLKSIRDYELAIAYVDDYGRMTTPLTSQQNTVFISSSDSINKNVLQATIPLAIKAPCFAKHFRFFIKQNRNDYDTVMPVIFYQDGTDVWLRLEGNEIDKINEGDFLYIKSDTTRVLDSATQTKVLEIKKQERNFLDLTATETVQLSGTYFRISPSGFILNEDDYTNYTFRGYDSSKNKHENPVRNNISYLEKPVYYGNAGLDDMVLGAGADYNGSDDIRYEVEIMDITGVDKYKYWNGTAWVDNGGLGFDITGAEQTLENLITIQFGATTGHAIGDNWLISAKSSSSGVNSEESNRAFAIFKSFDVDDASNVNVQDRIASGAIITLNFLERGDEGTDSYERAFTSTQSYANLEEWFYGDNIFTQINEDYTLAEQRVFFRRGDVLNDDGAKYINIDPIDGAMCFIWKSAVNQNNEITDDATRVWYDITIRQLEFPIVFETKPLTDDLDIFYEIGRTYDIDNDGYHLAFDGNDTTQTAIVNGIFELPVFNCFAWGNSVESYKIRDQFNGKSMKIDTRPSAPIPDYKENKRIATLTYSGVFNQTTNYNALNEFNLSLSNFYDIDDRYGPINRLVAWETDLDVYHQDKVLKALYKKAVLYNQDNSSNVATSDDVIGGIIAYTGEFGISDNPESLVTHNNHTYWSDQKRGYYLRKGRSGIEIISNFGLKDWFKDNFRTGDTTKIISGIDPYFDQVVVNINGYTLSFDEKVKGWTSFYSYMPDYFARLNNSFYTIKNGQLWRHNEEGSYLDFYGVKEQASVTTVFNQEHIQDVIFKTIIQEGDIPWYCELESNLGEGIIKTTEFNQKDSRWFAYIRQNESTTDLRGITQGIGNITSVNGSIIGFGALSDVVSVGDSLYQLNGTAKELIGVIASIDRVNNTITVSSVITTPVVTYFGFSLKDPRIEGSDIRGYYMQVKLSQSNGLAKSELYAVSTNFVKSFI